MCEAQQNERVGRRNIAADNPMKTDLARTHTDVAKAGDDIQANESAGPPDMKAKVDAEELTRRRRAFSIPETVDYPDVSGKDR